MGSSQADTDSQAAKGGYGSKTIGTKSSICLIVNNIMGPAMVALPFLSQRAGWLPLIFVNTACCLCSGLSSAMLCEALQRIPGNFFFTGKNPETRQRYEFCDAVKYYWGKNWCFAIRILFNISLQAQNIPAMVVSCQVLDDFFQQIFHHVYGIRYDVFPPQVGICHHSHEFVITLGLISCMLICIPFGCLNLDQNKQFQNVSFVCLVLLTVEFLVQFIVIGPHQGRPLEPSRTPLATDNQAKTLGVILFSWCFPSTLPSWVNEKGPGVKVTFVVWISVVFGWACKVAVALLGAWSYELLTLKNHEEAQNILLVMNHVSKQTITRVSAYLFNFTTLIPGIPVIAVIVRYNLLSSGGFGKVSASFLGVVLPWIVTVLLYRTALFVDILNWAAMLCMGPVNFIIPPLIFLSAVRRFPQARPARGTLSLDAVENNVDSPSLPSTAGGKFIFSGECQETEQASVVAVPSYLGWNRSSLAQIIAGVMASLVAATIALNLYFLVVLRRDIVD